ncbi:hypothetical protein Lrub_0828 [Legionella rubrilucens]|uniref:Uncharacterized protein n=1 Tax=Legionella rubrilucens TaxID=458 RepID=A0A0W0XUC3_9GAMM|nr:hypothetical protein [Legionella rubrilucens]KTD48477.1 hypothetical protein Lrub_0828 [Legionella rubrilucens]
MGFTLPKHLKDLLKQLNNLADNYKENRKRKDEERYFSLFRASTKNPEREQDAVFIENLASWVEANKLSYDTLDLRYENADYAQFVVPFLKRALSGMLMIELIKIYGPHGEKSTNSALGELLLEQFGIKKFKEAPQDKIIECIEELERLIDVINETTTADWINTNYRDIKLSIATALKGYEAERKLELS